MDTKSALHRRDSTLRRDNVLHFHTSVRMVEGDITMSDHVDVV